MVNNKRREKVIGEFDDLFKNNHTIKDLTLDIQFKKHVKPIQQKGNPVPINFLNTVGKELENLIEKGLLEKGDKTTENCFVSPAVITTKTDESLVIALVSQKINDACIKRNATMPNIEDQISKISAKITENDGEIWM